jgi:hypothetical protein
MQRSIGVTLSAVASILGSVLLLLIVLLASLATLLMPQQAAMPVQTRASVMTGACMMFVYCAWGIATAIGLFRLAPWARRSILIFSALLVFTGAVMAVVLLVVPLPQTNGSNPDSLRSILAVISCFFATFALLGGFWLYFFNRPSVKQQFSKPRASEPHAMRPLSVTLIAGLLLIAAASCVFSVFSPLSAFVLFGWFLEGWAARAVFVVLAICSFWLGRGLLRLNPLSRILTIGLLSVWSLNGALAMVSPGPMQQMFALIRSRYPEINYEAWMAALFRVSLYLGLALNLVMIWFLTKNRAAFAPAPVAALPPEPPPSDPQQRQP